MSVLPESSTLLLGGLVLLLLLLVWRRKGNKGLPLPPGPTGLPMLGNVIQMDMRAPYKTYMKWSKQYGPVITVHLGTHRSVILCGYKAVKEALVDQADDFAGRAQMPFSMKFHNGYGLGISNGERWRQLRRFTMSTLKDFGMGHKGMEQWIQEESNSSVMDLYNTFPMLMDHFPGSLQTVLKEMQELLDFIKGKIQEHKETLDPDNPRDFIDCFLIRMQQFHYDNLATTVMDLFFAGTESTSTTIRYALMILIKHPDIHERIQKEIDSLLGQQGIPQMEDRKSLPFTDAFIHEVQRYLDLAPLNAPHTAIKDISFRGYVIPKGTVIIPMLHSVLRDESQWENPWSFNPKHFLDTNGNFQKNPAFMPFSAGKRVCAGESLVRMELLIFLVSIVQHFHLSTPGGPSSIDITPELSSSGNVPRVVLQLSIKNVPPGSKFFKSTLLKIVV